MSASSADELHGWLSSLCMTTSKEVGAKRFIGARERAFAFLFVDLEEPGYRFHRSPCVRA